MSFQVRDVFTFLIKSEQLFLKVFVSINSFGSIAIIKLHRCSENVLLSIHDDHTNGPVRSSIIILKLDHLYSLLKESNAHSIAFSGSVVGFHKESRATFSGIFSPRAFASTSQYRVIAEVAMSNTSGWLFVGNEKLIGLVQKSGSMLQNHVVAAGERLHTIQIRSSWAIFSV